MAALALVVGGAAAAGTVVLRESIGYVQTLFLGFPTEQVVTLAQEQPWWRIMIAPLLGGLAVGLFLKFFMPGGRPQSVANVVENAALKDGEMNPKAGLAAFVASVISIGSGASVGREGPAVHLGATLASLISTRLGLRRTNMRTLLGCGVASAVAASFNAPLAGALFAHEVIVGHYALRAFAPVVIASVTGTLVTRSWYGDFPAFILPVYDIRSFWEFPAFAILGICSAILAISFMRSVAMVEDVVAKTGTPQWLRPAAGGLMVGIIAIWLPHVMGVGYEATDMALNEKLGFWLLIAILVAKAAATAISLGCGFGGGVFSPALVMGAMLGGAFGIVATGFFPHLSSGHGAYTLVGMGATASAVLGAPISTTLIVFEMTGDYSITIAVLVGSVIASVVTDQFHGRSFFEMMLVRRGVSLEGGRERRLVRSTHVRDIMKSDFVTVQTSADIEQVRGLLCVAPHGELFVLDDRERLFGTIMLSDLQEVAFDHSIDGIVNAGDVARQHPPFLLADDDIELALKKMEDTGEEHLPVIADADSQEVVGFVHELDVLNSYNAALRRLRAEDRGRA
jgi:CIC family chloride channel protein